MNNGSTIDDFATKALTSNLCDLFPRTKNVRDVEKMHHLPKKSNIYLY